MATLIVEDGTGLSTANAFVAAAYVDTYHSDRGNAAWAAGTADAKSEAIIRASHYLTNAFDWKGHKVNQRSQTMAWPRSGVSDADGYGVDSNAVPTEIEQACAEIALRELATPNQMTPDVKPSDLIKRTKAGAVEVEFANARTDPSAQVPVLLVVRDLIGPLLNDVGYSVIAGHSTRT